MLQPNPPRPLSPSKAKTVRGLPDQPSYGNNEVSILDLLRMLSHYRGLIISITLTTILIATVYCFITEDIYRAEITLAPITASENRSSALLQQLGNGGLPGINQDFPVTHTNLALAILRSRAFTNGFIADEGLAKHLLPPPKQKQGEAQQQADSAALEWQAYNNFNAIRKINVDRSTGIVSLSIEWSDPHLAAAWANSLVAKLNHYMRTTAITDAENSISYLNEQLNKTSMVELQNVIYRLIEGQIKKITLANVNDQYAFKIIDPALPPQHKVWPQRGIIIIFSALLGLTLGIFAAFLIKIIKKFKNTAEIKE